MIGFGLVLWHISHCRLFNAKSFLYIYIKYICLDLVCFYGTLIIVSHLVLNSYIIHIFYIYDFYIHFADNVFKRASAHFFHTVKWFHLLILYTINYSDY